MKLKQRDVVSTQGKDYVVEGVLTYRLGGKVYRLARVVDGTAVRWVEPLMDDIDDRILMFEEVGDLDISTPPPSTISYRGKSYVPRLSGQAQVEVSGNIPDRAAGACELWRTRAAGDLFLQIERWPDKVVVLSGESIHKNMLEIFPAS